jgi:hypothetical protein
MTTTEQTPHYQADGFVERDPGSMTNDELHGRAHDSSPCSGSCYSEFEEGRACSRHGRPAPEPTSLFNRMAADDDDSEIVPESCDADDVGDGGVAEKYYSSERMDAARRIGH